MGHLTKILIAGTALAACSFSTPALAQSECGRYSLPRCSEVGQKLKFDMRTGKNNRQPGQTDLLWTLNGSDAFLTTLNAWSSSGRSWVAPKHPASSHNRGTYVYKAQVNIAQDPYFYDNLRLKLNIGADNQVRAVRVNGIPVYGQGTGNTDFKSGNFETVTVDANASNGGPFIQGCNEIEIDAYNSEAYAGMSVRGVLTAKCTKCTTPRLDAAKPRGDIRREIIRQQGR